MDGSSVFPGYVPRSKEEETILEESEKVRQDGQSRAVLLYGRGGTGKTQLVRHLYESHPERSGEIWVEPIDIDDPEFWLLSNLEFLVAGQLDPDREHFGRYFEYLRRLPTFTRPVVGHETVVSHLGRIKRVFADCYREFITATGKNVVIVLDTVETIRGLYLLQTLTQWIKSLPGTLFILSGRPAPGNDPIRMELRDPYQQMQVTPIELGHFTLPDALSYLDAHCSELGLRDSERIRLAHLTRGHPLWLAFTVSHLRDIGLPPEAETGATQEEAQASVAEIGTILPYGQEPTREGQILSDAFQRSLVAPFQDSDFWHEAVKRLAVVRESIDKDVWVRLMADQPFPPDAPDADQAWQQLQETEWIRRRASRQHVTLHDAVAEVLAQRLIPVHDLDKQWRQDLWRRAADIYQDQTDRSDAALETRFESLDQRLQAWFANSVPVPDRSLPGTGEYRLIDESELLEEAAVLEVRRRQLRQAKAVRLYYEILRDYRAGTAMFLVAFAKATKEHDILFQDLLSFEMERFLPNGADTFNDVIKEAVDGFRQWLKTEEGRARYLDIAMGLADYLIRSEMPVRALALLGEHLDIGATPDQRYRLARLRGNACLRIPAQVAQGMEHFRRALSIAEQTESPTQHKLIAEAHKELGFYYRNEGRWMEADGSYAKARQAISASLSANSPPGDREEMASIHTNWAYVKGLTGSYREGANLVEAAIEVRRRLDLRHEEGMSWSVAGEVHRYSGNFQEAWKSYAEAEQIFQVHRSWNWLGLIYQEQAICLFQAWNSGEGISLLPQGRDPLTQSKRLITLALDLCRDLAVRGYPSALNRAGRIYGDEPEKALEYLEEGISWARRLSDGWFWFANLIEYAELCCRIWLKTHDGFYREKIDEQRDDIAAVSAEYEFPDLRGRWRLIQGYLRVDDWRESGNDRLLQPARDDFRDGFILIGQTSIGSSGAAAVPGEFRKFRELIQGLPKSIQAEWQAEFKRSWSREEYGKTSLLASLETLY